MKSNPFVVRGSDGQEVSHYATPEEAAAAEAANERFLDTYFEVVS